jgi:hypothetical protein
MNKEALTIAGVIIGGVVIAITSAMVVSLVADKIFSDNLWPRLLFAAIFVSVLVCFLFLKLRKNKWTGTEFNWCQTLQHGVVLAFLASQPSRYRTCSDGSCMFCREDT